MVFAGLFYAFTAQKLHEPHCERLKACSTNDFAMMGENSESLLRRFKESNMHFSNRYFSAVLKKLTFRFFL